MNNIEIESIQELHAVYKTTCKKAARHKYSTKDRKSTRLNSSHRVRSRMPSSA